MEMPFEFIQQSMILIGTFLLPLFAILLVLGIITSILQSIFQIHESSISYFFKLIVSIAYFFVTGKEFYNNLLAFIINVFEGR